MFAAGGFDAPRNRENLGRGGTNRRTAKWAIFELPGRGGAEHEDAQMKSRITRVQGLG
jgi:hypothetical protein